ncbi:unnamed protein product [Didymodactylos carnosus]|uniref:Uncharacterized protein n=1 Tax=Didymodactylos carnosus TaxID=1234261 RepID=A0A816D1P0_9BILA|nr:unnamed protein product [Didymodactylos carnosus]CAF1631229.1 unnamed protein product [Didymodactylos carnosus]CAF3890375.1 unnamed protein product [Didymodactylos carnosus]CAF4530345.1 unnamed protein product [Didymodactylos carnosus]
MLIRFTITLRVVTIYQKGPVVENFVTAINYYNSAIDKANDNEQLFISKYYDIYEQLYNICQWKSEISDKDKEKNNRLVLKYLNENLRLISKYPSSDGPDIGVGFVRIAEIH